MKSGRMARMDSGLKKYLDRYFPIGRWGEINGQEARLDKHFIDKFGVKVSNENDLFIFNYSDQQAVFSFPITHECRGIILRHAHLEWEVVARPFDKFFNHFEPNCPLYDDAEFDKLAPSLQLDEKLDGTMITCWFDRQRQEWRVSTRGAITPQKCADFQGVNGDAVEGTYDDLFRKTAGHIQWALMDKSNTYVFELCTSANRIFSKYPKDTIYLLAAREARYGVYVPYSVVDELAAELYADGMNVGSPTRVFLSTMGISTKTQLVEWVEKMYDAGGEVENPEGYVAYHGCKPIAKFKSRKYLDAASMYSGGNLAHQRMKLIAGFFDGNADDLYGIMAPEMRVFMDSLKDRHMKMYGLAVGVFTMLVTLDTDDKKVYASYLNDKCRNAALRSFFFDIRTRVKGMDGSNFKDAFDSWLRRNYGEFDGYWKGKEKLA